MTERSFIKRLGYNVIRVLARLAGVVAFRIRCHGRRLLPANGAALVCANHQSFMDPVLVGLACDRRLNYLARKSLFDIAPLRWVIEFLDAIPIDRDGLGLEGLKETLRRLKRGELVLIFPEGTRTTDGRIAPLKPGFCSLARRGKAPLVPVGIDGAFEAWPRNSPLPQPAVIHVCIGDPITPEQTAAFDDNQLVAELHRRIQACHAHARRARGGAAQTLRPG